MSKIRINPAAIAEGLGGVICIDYPVDKNKTEEVFETLLHAVRSNMHYIISVYNIATKVYFGNPELLYDGGDHVTMIHTSISHSNLLTKTELNFYRDEVKINSRTFSLSEI